MLSQIKTGKSAARDTFERRLAESGPPRRRGFFVGFCFLGGAFQKLVDVGAGVEQLVRDRQRGHQHQPLVADVAMLVHQPFELSRQIFRDFFEPLNFVIATCKAIRAPIEIDCNVSHSLRRRRRPPARTTRTSFAWAMVMKRIESPINPVQCIGGALLQLRNSLLGGRKLRPKPRVLCPDITVDNGLPGRLYVVSPLDLRGVAYSHGLSTPFRATRLTRVSPSLVLARYVRIVNAVNKRQRDSVRSGEKLKSGRQPPGLATLTESYTVTLKTP